MLTILAFFLMKFINFYYFLQQLIIFIVLIGFINTVFTQSYFQFLIT